MVPPILPVRAPFLCFSFRFLFYSLLQIQDHPLKANPRESTGKRARTSPGGAGDGCSPGPPFHFARVSTISFFSFSIFFLFYSSDPWASFESKMMEIDREMGENEPPRCRGQVLTRTPFHFACASTISFFSFSFFFLFYSSDP